MALQHGHNESKRMTVYFYSAREEPYGCFSGFSRHALVLDGLRWPTSEHYYQAQKFAGAPEHMEAVRRASTPKQAAELGRDRSRPLREDWEAAKDDVMRRAVLAKFEQHAAIRAILLGTGKDEIVERTTGDTYWGCGSDVTGRNMLGLILMETRELLRGREAQALLAPESRALEEPR